MLVNTQAAASAPPAARGTPPGGEKTYHSKMEPTPAKPFYHHPIPWQVVVALVLIGATIVSLTFFAATLWDLYASGKSALWPFVVMALATVFHVVAAVCVAARLNWARLMAFRLSWLVVVIAGVSGVITIAVADDPGPVGPTPLPGLILNIILFFLLRSEKSEVYTYKGGGGSLPEDWKGR